MKSHLIIQVNSFEEARNKIKEARKKNPDKLIGFTSSDDELNRKIIEKEKVDIFMPILLLRKDWQKQRNSGLDNVMAKAAKKGNIAIGINLDEIINSKTNQKAEILARIKQNIKLCNKNKLKMKFIGIDSRDIYDLKALGLVLGMPTWMIKEA